jgi:outer membrane protein assembly factor BamB
VSANRWSVGGLRSKRDSRDFKRFGALGVIYILNGNPYQLEARSEQNGSLLWSWRPPGDGFKGDIIVTRNLLFLSTRQQVHAVSPESQQSVWSFLMPGQLALFANGVLYVAVTGESGHLTLFAINVK